MICEPPCATSRRPTAAATDSLAPAAGKGPLSAFYSPLNTIHYPLSTIHFPFPRRGFTLVELLVVVVIIGMLASISLAALAQARGTARRQRTKATIAKLNDVVMNRYASYRTRRVPISTQGMNPQDAARLRLAALRQLIRLEMPERPTDIVTDATTIGPPAVPPTPADAGYLAPNPNVDVHVIALDGSIVPGVKLRRPALSCAYLRLWQASSQDLTHARAECLYMIVTLGDPDARGQFMESEIDDLDNDGLPEFVDGWGKPIYFIRWAPGFNDSDVQRNIDPPTDATQMSVAPVEDHDPFDLLKLDSAAWRLLPLIYSAGPDGEYGIWLDHYPAKVPKEHPTDPDAPPPYVWKNDTYETMFDPFLDYDVLIGQPFRHFIREATGALTNPRKYGPWLHYDNIHNHRIEAD